MIVNSTMFPINLPSTIVRRLPHSAQSSDFRWRLSSLLVLAVLLFLLLFQNFNFIFNVFCPLLVRNSTLDLKEDGENHNFAEKKILPTSWRRKSLAYEGSALAMATTLPRCYWKRPSWTRHDSGYMVTWDYRINVYLALMASLESILSSSLCYIELQLGVLWLARQSVRSIYAHAHIR